MNSRSVVNLFNDDLFNEEGDSNIVHLDEYINESTGQRGQGTYSLPGDGVKDKISLEWVLAPKDTTTVTLPTFNDMVMQRHASFAKTGGLTGISARLADSTGWSNINTEEEVNLAMIEDPDKRADIISQMKVIYGEQALDNMTSNELYRACKDFILSKKTDAK